MSPANLAGKTHMFHTVFGCVLTTDTRITHGISFAARPLQRINSKLSVLQRTPVFHTVFSGALTTGITYHSKQCIGFCSRSSLQRINSKLSVLQRTHPLTPSLPGLSGTRKKRKYTAPATHVVANTAR